MCGIIEANFKLNEIILNTLPHRGPDLKDLRLELYCLI